MKTVQYLDNLLLDAFAGHEKQALVIQPIMVRQGKFTLKKNPKITYAYYIRRPTQIDRKQKTYAIGNIHTFILNIIRLMPKCGIFTKQTSPLSNTDSVNIKTSGIFVPPISLTDVGVLHRSFFTWNIYMTLYLLKPK